MAFLGVLPSRKPRVVAGGGHELNLVALRVVFHLWATDVELRIGRVVGRGASVEVLVAEPQHLAFEREAGEVGAGGSDAGVGLGVGDGAVGGDVDLLAAGDFDVQATESILAAEIGLGARGALTDLRDDVRAVGCGWTTADAEDEPGGFDDGGVEIGGVQGYQLEDALGGWEGRLQFAVIAGVHGREVAILAARLGWLAVFDGAELRAVVAGVLRRNVKGVAAREEIFG